MRIRPCQVGTWRAGWVALSLIVLTVALRLPLITDASDVFPSDGSEYLGIAWHLAHEGRWRSSIKWHFFTDEPVVHPALADRPPLYPLWSAIWLDGGPIASQVYRVRLANIGLSAAAVVLAFLLLCRLFPFSVAAGSALLFTFYPAFLRNSVQPLTEPLFLVLMLGAFHTFLGEHPRPFLTGLLSGLAYLTRPAGVLLLLVFGAAAVLTRGSTGGRGSCRATSVMASETGSAGASPSRLSALHTTKRSSYPISMLTWMLAGFVIVCLPYWGAVWREYGRPFYSVLSYNFSIGSIYEGTYYGFERHFPTPGEFLRATPGRVAGLVWAQTRDLAATMGRSLRWLWPLALFLRGRDLRRHALLLAFAALNFVLHALSWTVRGAARYQFPEYLFLAPVLLEAPLRHFASVSREWVGRAVAGIALAAMLGACLLGDARLFQEKRSPDRGIWLEWALRDAVAWVNAQPWPEPGICAANYPHLLNQLTRRPTVVLPRFRDTAQLERFLVHYHPGALILAVGEPAEERLGDMLLQRPWTARKVRPELAAHLAVALVERRPRADARGERVSGRELPEQWLVVLRVRPSP